MRAVAIVHHRVADFDAWKAVYDAAATLRQAGGVLEQAVLRSQEDPAAVVVVHTFATPGEAQAFFGRDDLREAMDHAGVDPGSVHVELLDEVEAAPVPAG